MGNNNLGTAGVQMHSASMHYCRDGFKGSLTALTNGFWMNGSTEVDLTSPVTYNLGVAVAPLGTVVWDKNTVFALGATVFWGNNIWVAAVGNTGQLPNAANTTYWTAYVPRIVPFTCAGQRPCVVETRISAVAAAMRAQPYDPRIAYAVGDLATVRQGNSMQVYAAAAAQAAVANGTAPAIQPIAGTALAAGTASYPSPDNTNNWTASYTVAVGTIATDPVPNVACASACYVQIFAFGTSPGPIPIGSPGRTDLLETWAQGTAVVDTSLTAAYDSPPKSPTGIWRPAALLGVPNDNTRNTVAIVPANSIGTGASEHNVQWGTGVTAGGSGYTTADINKVCELTVSGAGTYAVAGGTDPKTGLAYGVPKAMITGVNTSTGAMTSQQIYDQGTMNTPSANPNGGVLPTGTQTITQKCYPSATAGSGATVSVSEAAGWDFGDDMNGKGFIQRALNTLGMPWTLVGRAGDTIAEYYTTQSHRRFDMVRRIRAKSAIIQGPINDAAIGAAAAEAYVTQMAKDLKAAGVKSVYLTTLSPYAASSDGFLTTANQTVNASATPFIIAYNQWARANDNVAPFDGTFLTGEQIMSAQDSGLVAPSPDGVTPCWYMCGPLHPTSRGHIGMALGISNYPQKFKVNFLLRKDVDPSANDNAPMFLQQVG